MPRSRTVPIILLALSVAACTLPGAASPTPFSFPTPDLTLTAMLAPTQTTEPPTPILAPAQTSQAATAAASPTSEEISLGTLTPTITTQNARPNGTPAGAPKLEEPPVIDGDLNEWNEDPIAIDQIVFGAGNWSGSEDASGQYLIGWDDQALYLAVSVTDDAFVQVSAGRNMFKGDIIELQLDADLAGDFFSSRLSADDYQVGLSPGNFGSIASDAYRWYPVSEAGALPDISIAAVTTEGGYDLEAKIPWTVFGLSAQEGARFGFALSISDNDLPGQAVQQSMASSVKSRTLTNPTTWGTLVLGP